MNSPLYRSVHETNLSDELFSKILCPNMRTGIRMSLLNPDSDGWVEEDEIRSYLEYIGLIANTKVEDLLISTGVRAPTIKKQGCINLTAFKDTFLDHGSSSGILNTPYGFSQERLDLLLGYADSTQKLNKDSLSLAMNNFHQCPVNKKSFSGSNILAFEFAGMLEIFGRQDSPGAEKYFTQDDIVSLWKHNHFPEDWCPPTERFYSTWAAFSNYLKMMFNRFKLGWRKA